MKVYESILKCGENQSILKLWMHDKHQNIFAVVLNFKHACCDEVHALRLPKKKINAMDFQM